MGFQFYYPSAPPNIIATLVMFLWIPAVFWLFQRFPTRRAIVISFVAAALFLPEVRMVLPGLPDYSKMSAASYGVFLFTLLFDIHRFKNFKFGFLDLPMTIWCICPIFSSLANGLGLYDGVATSIDQSMSWGIPYLLGRIYLNDLTGLRQLASGMFVGGLIYIPLCLYESRMSPQLHNILYGGHPHAEFAQSVRFGGYRPMVFMSHGLAVATWMMAALLIGCWLWRAGVIRQALNLPLKVTVPLLLITFILLRSTGVYLLVAVGLAILYIGARLRTALPVYLMIGAIAAYLYLNAMTESYFTDQLIDVLSQYLPPDRIGSLEFRFNNEELLADHARERVLFGWGGWGRALLYDAEGNQLTIQDSSWIIAFGHHGIVGLTSLFTALLLPIVSVFSSKAPPRLWERKDIAPVAVLAMTLLLYTVDSLVNAPRNPLYTLICGGLTGYVMQSSAVKSVRAPLRRSPYPAPQPAPVLELPPNQLK